MKRWTSRIFQLVSAVYVAMPLLFLIWIFAFYGVPFKKLFSVIFSPLFIFTSIMSFVTGWGLLFVKRWSWYTSIAVTFLLVYESAFTLVEYGSQGSHGILFFLVYCLLLFLAMNRLKVELRVPYLFPRVKWWERVTLEHCSIAVGVFRESQGISEGQIIDISVGGCFVKAATEFIEGENVLLKFFINEDEFNLSGEVVWKTSTAVTHPRGAGVKFLPIDRKLKRKLRVSLGKLPINERIQDDD